MSYAGSGYLYGLETIPTKPGAGDPALEPSPDSSGIGPTDFNKLEAFRQSAASHALAADFQGFANMAGGRPGPAPSNQVYQWAEAGDLIVSRNSRLGRKQFHDFDVSEFGVLTPDSSGAATANTATIQAALDFGFNEVSAGRPCTLILPPGVFYINGTLLWRGTTASSPALRGALRGGDAFDHASTMLRWTGATNGTMMYAQSTNRGRLEDVFFDGNATAGICLHMAASTYADPSVSAACSGMTIRDCSFVHVKAGVSGNGLVALGTDPALTAGLTLQQSEACFHRCSFVGEQDGSAGFSWTGLQAYGIKTLAGGNCKNFAAYDCTFVACQTAIDWSEASGNFLVWNFIAANINYAFKQNDAHLIVMGGDIEAGDTRFFRLLYGTGGGGACAAEIVGLDAAAYMDGAVGTLIDYGGILSLRRCVFTNANYSVSGLEHVTNPYVIKMNVGVGSVSSLESEGNVFYCCYTDYIPVVDATGDLRPLLSTYGGNSAFRVSSWGDKNATTFGGTPQPLLDFDSRAWTHYSATFNGPVRFRQFNGGTGGTDLLGNAATEHAQYIHCAPNSTDMNATLPTAVGIDGRWYTVKNNGIVGLNVVVGTTSAQTIDGAATYSIPAGSAQTFVSDGANWFSLGSTQFDVTQADFKVTGKLGAGITPAYPFEVGGSAVGGALAVVNATSVGTGDIALFVNGPTVTGNLATFAVLSATATGALVGTLKNFNSSSGGAHAQWDIATAIGGGDPTLNWDTIGGGGQSWAAGIDQSDSQAWKLASSNTLGGGGSLDKLRMDPTSGVLEVLQAGVVSGGRNTYKGATGITAHAGGGQGSAVALAAEVNFVVTVSSAGDSVKLPTAALGLRVVVYNQGASAMDIFPASGASIDALGANNAYSLAAGSSREFWGQSTTTWGSR